MKKIFLTSIMALFVCFGMQAQSKKEKDINAIKSMCGCYEVTFNFTETFNYSEDSTYIPSKNKIAHGLEWANLIEDENNKLSIQHILIVGNPAEPMIVKHWRQDWLYENTNFYMFNHDNQWTYQSKSAEEVTGQWTQKVYQVDDSPRYEGSATWVHVDGKSYWENTTPAPLPRREYTQRSDYNVTLRGNRQEITDYGWFHEQDNEKIIREAGKEDIVLAKEKGFNTYKKVADSRCKAAAKWWTENENKWAAVRKKWDQVFSENQDLELKDKVDNKPLFKQLSEETLNESLEIEEIIDAYIVKK
ncbi:MAG: hypothetical protein CMC74_07480 [Flavobacteriaceae bacterium]|nr:hypothetical protein [Flavobacteriaceae bacterium]|tara:strand:+ start:345 stop:1253 length:909 start_codon:yes stop_codon:yes gene_type:complete